jgi:hypothetical protein
LNENVGVGFLFNPLEQHPGKDKEEEGGGRGALVRQSPSFLPSNNSSLSFIQIQIDSPFPHHTQKHCFFLFQSIWIKNSTILA